MTTHVWLATSGDNGEGVSIDGVFATKESAAKAALSKTTHNEGGWVLTDDDDETYSAWMNHCDWVRIERYEVK